MPALNPDAQIRPDEIIDDPELFPDPLPREVSKSGDFYAIKKQLADGRIAIEWYKRGRKLAEGEAPQDPVIARSQGYAKAVADEYAKQQQQQGQAARQTETIGGRVKQWNPETNAYDIDLGPAGTQAPGQAEPPKTEDRGGRRYVWQPNPGGPQAGGQWLDVGPAPATAAERAAQQADRPQPIPGTMNTTSPRMGSLQPDGTVTWVANPNYQKPTPQPIPLPAGQKWVIWDNGDGTTRTEKNPNYKPPSQIRADPSTGRLQEITEDDNGRPVVRDVRQETTIKPTDLPVLQAKYGEIAQGLGQLAQELNGKVSRGEMTPEERQTAFTAAHQQAKTLVDEINGMIDNSRQTWAQEIQQRGQTFGEAANRRSFAGNVLSTAVGEGGRVAMSAGPGHGAAIAGGVAALLGIGQQFAQGMGGLPEMNEIGMPRALQQAREAGLPGARGSEAGPPQGLGGGPPGLPPGAPPGVPPGPPAGGPNALGLGASGAVPAPGGAPAPLPAPLLRPPPPVGPAPLPLAPAAGGPQPAPLPPAPPGGPQPAPLPLAPPARDDWRTNPGAPPTTQRNLPVPGGPLGLSGLGAEMSAGMAGSPIGMPVALGGGGAFDPSAELQSMLGASTSASSFGGEGMADPAWEEAVKRAYADASRYGGF